MKTNYAIVPGSLSAITTQTGKTLAESFVHVDCVVIVDTSGSMASRDSRGGQSRYDVACEELRNLQQSLPGKIALLAFSDRTEFCPAGVPTFLMGSTNLTGALKFAKVADTPGMRFVVISDGQPDYPQGVLEVAKMYQNKIDCIHVGPEIDFHSRDFLQRLSDLSGGQMLTRALADGLSNGIETLLLHA